MFGEQEERHHRVRNIALRRPRHRVAVEIERAQGDEGGRQRGPQSHHGSAPLRRWPAEDLGESIARGHQAEERQRRSSRRRRRQARSTGRGPARTAAPRASGRQRLRKPRGRPGCAGPLRRCRCAPTTRDGSHTSGAIPIIDTPIAHRICGLGVPVVEVEVPAPPHGCHLEPDEEQSARCEQPRRLAGRAAARHQERADTGQEEEERGAVPARSSG